MLRLIPTFSLDPFKKKNHSRGQTVVQQWGNMYVCPKYHEENRREEGIKAWLDHTFSGRCMDHTAKT